MGESIPHELQNLNKIYGHHGLMLQPSFLDPLQMQYFQHPFEDAYGSRSARSPYRSSSSCMILMHDFDASDHGTPSFAVLPKTRYIGLKWTGMESFKLNKRLMMLSSGSDTKSLPFYFIQIRTSLLVLKLLLSLLEKKIEYFRTRESSLRMI